MRFLYDDPGRTPVQVRRQVSTVDHYASIDVFSLGTATTTLMFSADRLTATLEPGPAADPRQSRETRRR
jgi:hypothetical protein